jgi:hypothetical protein
VPFQRYVHQQGIQDFRLAFELFVATLIELSNEAKGASRPDLQCPSKWKSCFQRRPAPGLLSNSHVPFS